MAHILVVDGDPSSRMIVRTLLDGAGHEVTEAEDGAAGLWKMGQRIPDMVITELYMDGMEGMEFLRRIREAWPSEPVLIMSSQMHSGVASTLQMAKLLGAIGLLDKPIIERDLLQAVGAILAA